MDITKLEALGLSPEMIRAIQDTGYEEFTPIQEKSIPLLLEGRDIIGQASTGTGKTAAFGIPAIEKIVDPEDQADPQVLVLCPTRELAMQVSDELRKFSKYKEGLRVVTVYGGQNIDTQIRALKRAAVVVGTPGRVIDHIRRRTLKLMNIKLAILDEADEMLDMGFVDDIKQILFNTPENRQTALFSATMPPPIMRLTQRFLRNPETIKGDEGDTAFNLIQQYYVEVPKSKKAQGVRLLFEQQGAHRGLIFCNTKRMVEVLTRELTEMGLAVEGLHGDMAQGARTRAMAQFKSGETNLLIATDVAARGIDASGVDIIINYDIPQDMEYYVHRIGRTGRAGNTGVAFTLIAGSGEFFSLCDIQDTTGIQLQPYYLNGLEETPEDKFYARNTNRNENGPRRSSQPRHKGANGGRSAANGGNAVISFDVGSNHDVTERQIINSILKYSRIKKDEIGEITIKENESRVELAPDVARHVMRTMQNGTINEFLVVCKAVSGAKEVNAKGEARGNGRKGGSRGGSKGGKPSSNRGKGRVVRR